MSEINTRRIVGITALNYLRRPLYSPLELVVFIPILAQLTIGLTMLSKAKDLLNPLQLMAPMFVAQYICHQWKQCLAYPQARIIPNYRCVQTLVMVALLAGYTTLCVSVYWLRNDMACGLMMLALYLLMIDALLTLTMFQRAWWIILPWVGIWIWIASPEGQQAIGNFMLSYHGFTSLGISIAGFIVGGLLIRSSLRQTDESPGFNRELIAVSSRVRPAAQNTKMDSALGRFLFGPSHRDLIQARNRNSAWVRVRRWQVGTAGFRQAVALGFFTLVFASLFGWFNPGGKHLFAGTLFVVSMGLPAILTAASWGARASRVSADLMRPVTRRSYFREMFLAAALSFAELWLTLTLLMVAGYFLAGVDTFLQLPPVIALSLTFNLLFFGASAWLSRYGENIPSLFVVSMIVLIPVMVTLVTYLIPHPSDIMFPLVVIAFGVCGVVLTWDAHRRWLRAEVGLIGFGRRKRGLPAMQNLK